MITIRVMVGTSTVVMGVMALPQLSLMTQWMIVVMMSVAAG